MADWTLSEDRTESESLLFEPRLWRYFSVHTLALAVAMIGVAAIVNYAIHYVFVLPLAFMWATINVLRFYGSDQESVRSLAIRVTSTGVTGPRSFPSWDKESRARTAKRSSIALAEIDRVRSTERSLVDRLLGWQHLYSLDGEHIYLARWAFARADVRRLLTELDLGD